MKKALFILLTLLINANVQAQLQLLDEDGNDISYDTVHVNVYPSKALFEMHVKLVNQYGGSFITKTRRTNVQLINGSQNYFCWGTCYSPTVNVNPGNDHVIIPPSDTCTTPLLCYFKPLGNTGEQMIRYTIFDTGANIDSVSFVLVIHVAFPNDPLLLQIPDDDFVTNTDVYLSTDIDTNNASFHEILYPLTITNNTNVIKQILVKKVELNVVNGSLNYFSWKSTYSPAVSVDTAGILVYPNTSITNKFKAIYRPNGNVGESVVRYVFYNKFDTNDSSYVTVHYNAIQNGTIQYFETNFSVYPNPTSDYINITGLENVSRIAICNLRGEKVMENTLTEGMPVLQVATLSKGIYYLSIQNKKGTFVRTFVKQ